MMPVVPAVIWLMAAACLVLLILIIFGYHLYQRSRLAALAADAGDVASLAGRKEQLEADIASMRSWLATQTEESQKFDAERRQQELLRIELAQLERTLAARAREAEASLKLAAGLEAGIVKKRNLLARLENETRSLEQARAELEPVRTELASMKAELEQGKIRLGLLAEQEIRTGALQRQAEELARGLEELKGVIEPLQKEKDRLRAYIDQARNAVAIKSERLREQNAVLRDLETACHDLQVQKNALERDVNNLAAESQRQEELAAARREDQDTETLRQQKQNLQKELGQLSGEIGKSQTLLLLLRDQIANAHAAVENSSEHARQRSRRKHGLVRPVHAHGFRPALKSVRPETIYQKH